MRSAVFIAALAGAVVASPIVEKRQDIDFDIFDVAEVPDTLSAPIGGGEDPVTYDPSAAAAAAAADPVTEGASSKIKARGAICAAQPLGSGPVPQSDTAADFLAMPVFNKTALDVRYPNAYSLAFGPTQASAQAGSYLGYYTLDNYDPLACQAKCDANKKSCYGFNIYYERDPTQDANDDSCKNPPSTTNIKCALYGSTLDSKSAKNFGQWRNKFQVVIAGSMAFNKIAAPANIPGFTPPVALDGSINEPRSDQPTYMGAKYYPGPYNPEQCTQACQATSDYLAKTAPAGTTPKVCSFVNSYVLSKNFEPQGTYCGLYSQTWSNDYAVNYGQWRGNDRYTVSQSYGWSLAQ